MESTISNETNPEFSFMETIFLKVSSLLMPWVILGAIPRFQFGYWGQIEGQIVLTHIICSLLAINILVVLFRHKQLRFILWEPLIVIPAILGLFSVFSALFQRIPNLALYGSPQLGQGAFWYFDLSIMTLLYFMVWSNKNWRIPLLISIFLVILFVTIFSLRPDLGQYQLRFFYFFDYLCFYGLAFIIIVSSFLNLYTKSLVFKIVNQRYFLIFLYISLGPYFWILKNESACLLWLLVGLFWIAIEILKTGEIFKDIRKIIYINLYSPKFFTFIILLASFFILLSSFVFWDGTSNMGDSLKKTSNPLLDVSHFATLVARGSIIRVLLEHLDSVKVFFVGYGWGNISELLISSFTKENFTQINTGNRVHFHTHNEVFEHIFSIGAIGFVFYVLYAFHLLKNAFIRGGILPYLWLLYFLICCFWFQFISSLPLLALATATLITHPNSYSDRYIKKLKYFRDNLYFSMSYLILIFGFLVFASVIGLITTNNTQEFSPNRLIQLSKRVDNGQSCSFSIRDFDRGGIHLSQMLDGYTTYIRNQIKNNEPLVKTDYDVMKWYLCAVDEVVATKKGSIELVNADINTVSYFSSIEPSDLRGNLTNLRNNYLNIWDERIRLLLTLAPKRSDQITPYVSTLLISGKFDEINKICSFARQFERDVPYCDLAEAAIYIGNNELDKAVFLIERADQSGALDVEDKCLRVESGGVLSGTFRSEAGQKCLKWQRYIDPKLIKVLREFVKAYKETNN